MFTAKGTVDSGHSQSLLQMVDDAIDEEVVLFLAGVVAPGYVNSNFASDQTEVDVISFTPTHMENEVEKRGETDQFSQDLEVNPKRYPSRIRNALERYVACLPKNSI